MDAHRLKALIDIILADYKQFDIPMKFKSMLTALQEYANAPNPESAGKYRDQLAALKSALSQSRVHELQPLQRNILAKVGAIDFTGEGLIAQVETAHSKSTTPSDILLAVQDLAKRFEQFQKTIQGIVSHFEVLGIHARESAPDEQEISIILPDSLTRREILQVEKTLHKWGQAIGHIQELVLGRGTPVKLAAVDDGSIVVVIARAITRSCV